MGSIISWPLFQIKGVDKCKVWLELNTGVVQKPCWSFSALSCLLLSSFVMTCQKMLILKLYWCGIDFGAKLFLICHPKIIYVLPKISCSEIGALVNKQKWIKKAVNQMNNWTKNKIFSIQRVKKNSFKWSSRFYIWIYFTSYTDL